MAGTAREVVARALKGMEEEGVIKIETQHRISWIAKPLRAWRYDFGHIRRAFLRL